MISLYEKLSTINFRVILDDDADFCGLYPLSKDKALYRSSFLFNGPARPVGAAWWAVGPHRHVTFPSLSCCSSAIGAAQTQIQTTVQHCTVCMDDCTHIAKLYMIVHRHRFKSVIYTSNLAFFCSGRNLPGSSSADTPLVTLAPPPP